MKIFKLIEVDMVAERQRIAKVEYSLRQRLMLFELCDLFEAGDWQGCLDHINLNFKYDDKAECPEVEYIGVELQKVLSELGYENFFTRGQLLKEAEEVLAQKATKIVERTDSLNLQPGDKVRTCNCGKWSHRTGTIASKVLDDIYGVSFPGDKDVRYFLRVELDYLP